MDWLSIGVMGIILFSLFLGACVLFTLPLRLVTDDVRCQRRVALLFVSGVAVLIAVISISEEFFSGTGTPLWGLHMTIAQKVLLCTMLPTGAVLGLFLILTAKEEFDIGTDAYMNKIATEIDAETKRTERERSEETDSSFTGGAY